MILPTSIGRKMNRNRQILNFYSFGMRDLSANHRVPAKLMIAGGINGKVIATVKFTGKFDPKKVFFRTFAGEEWPSELNIDKRSYTVTVKPGRTEGATDLLALYQPKGSDKPDLVGKLKIYTYNAVNKEVVLVPVEKATIPDGLADELTKIYKPYGVNLTVTSKKDSYPELWWDTDGDHLLDATGTSRLSRYSEEMKRLNSSYRLDEQGYFRKDALYLFVLAGAKTEDGLPLLGDMPRGKQFGYVFTSAGNMAVTAAHELGHGIFRLAHTFDDYGYAQKSTQNLMDYSGGKELTKYQWDILHDPGIAGWLDDAQDGQSLIAYSNAIEAIKATNQSLKTSVVVSGKWKTDESLSVQLDNLPLSATKISSKILKPNSTIKTTEYQVEEIAKTTEVKISFVDQSTVSQVVVTFQLPKDKLDQFIDYLNIDNTDIKVEGVEEIDGNLVAFIPEEPAMPKLKLNLTSKSANPLEIQYALQYKLKYSYEGKEYEFGDPVLKGVATVKDKVYAFDWGKNLQGGDLTINWKQDDKQGTKTILVRGKHPEQSVIKEYGQTIGCNSYWFFWNITNQESSFRQFYNAGKYSPVSAKAQTTQDGQKGLPLWGGPRGMGLKQLDNWTRNGQTVYCGTAERWNWKENLKVGKEVMDSKVQIMSTSTKSLYGIKPIATLLDENKKDRIADPLKVGQYTFVLANSPYFPHWDFGQQPDTSKGEKSILEAHLIVMYNGGFLLDHWEDVVVGEPNPETGEWEPKTYHKLAINPAKTGYLTKVLGGN